MIRPALLLLGTFGILTVLQADQPPAQDDLRLICSAVKKFNLGKSVPGVLQVDPLQASGLLMDTRGEAFAALGHTTDGRVAAFTHEVFLSAALWQDQEGARELMTNVIRWAGQSRSPSVGLSPEAGDLEPLLQALEMQVRILRPAELDYQVDVFCLIGQHELSAQAMEALKRFSLKGGGVVVAATPWEFSEEYPDFSNFPANEVSSLAGIRFRPQGLISLKKGHDLVEPMPEEGRSTGEARPASGPLDVLRPKANLAL